MNKLELADHLEQLGKGEIQPNKIGFGICYEVDCVAGEYLDEVRALMTEWPRYSGNTFFPVPHPEYGAAFGYSDAKSEWEDDEYGDSRRELCLWLADEIRRRENED